jgi:hypothetical protein
MSDRRTRLLVAQLVLAVLGAVVVGVCELVLSYDAERAVALAAGVDHAVDDLFPVGLDGLLMTATFAAVALHGAPVWTRRYIWSVFGGGLLVALACNGAHSFAVAHGGRVVLSGPQAFLVSAVPPVSAAAAVHLVVLVVRHVGQVLAGRPAVREPGKAPRRHVEPPEPTVEGNVPALRALSGGGRRGRRQEALTAVRDAVVSGKRAEALTGAWLADQLGVSASRGRALLAEARSALVEEEGGAA